MFRRKRVPLAVPMDIEEARLIRREQEEARISLINQEPFVAHLVRRLDERRERNHFGEEIQVTFTPRGRRV